MLVSVAWILPAVFAVLNRIAQPRLSGLDPFTAHALLRASGDWLIYGFLTPGVFAVSKRWPLTRPHLIRRAMLHLGLSLLLCVSWATCPYPFRMVLVSIFAPKHLSAAMQGGAVYFWRSI